MVELGRVVATAAVAAWLSDDDVRHAWLVDRINQHAAGEDGAIHPDDVAANDWARRNGARVLTIWPVPDALGDGNGNPVGPLWIITEADRSATTALWRADY